jgi:hypothetical protein
MQTYQIRSQSLGTEWLQSIQSSGGSWEVNKNIFVGACTQCSGAADGHPKGSDGHNHISLSGIQNAALIHVVITYPIRPTNNCTVCGRLESIGTTMLSA